MSNHDVRKPAERSTMGSRGAARGRAIEDALPRAVPARQLAQRIGYHGNHTSDCSRSGDLNGWTRAGEYEDIWYDTMDGIARIKINRPEVRNAFRPKTLFELSHAFNVARDDPDIGVIILTGAGDQAFCSGGDQRIRGDDGYRDPAGIGRPDRVYPLGR